MKILGVSNENCIVQVTKNELANILGFFSEYDDNFSTIIHSKKEAEFPISPIYQNYWKIKSIITGPRYDTARTKLQEMLDTLQPINELISKLKEEYEINKTQF